MSCNKQYQFLPRLQVAFGGLYCVQELEKSQIQVAPRPGKPGTLGKAIQLLTNFYKANFQNVPPLLHHDIRIDRMRFNPETSPFSQSHSLPCCQCTERNTTMWSSTVLQRDRSMLCMRRLL